MQNTLTQIKGSTHTHWNKSEDLKDIRLRSVTVMLASGFGNTNALSVISAANWNYAFMRQSQLILQKLFDHSIMIYTKPHELAISHLSSSSFLRELFPLLPCSSAQTTMTFFGKLISSDKDIKKRKPLKLPPIDKNQVLKRFKRTLVGRPLLREVQDHKLQALTGFLPTIWQCEGRVQGFEMGDGRVHFRFQNEDDLLVVMENRPYHYDGSMIALE